MDMHPVIVIYDITENTRRNALIQILEYHGLVRIQYSVFAGFISNAWFQRLNMEIQRQYGDDSRIIAIRLCECCTREMLQIGCVIPQSRDDVVVL